MSSFTKQDLEQLHRQKAFIYDEETATLGDRLQKKFHLLASRWSNINYQ